MARKTHRCRGFTPYLRPQLLGERPRRGRGLLAQFLAQHPLQLPVLAQGVRGLSRSGVETHQVQVRLFPERGCAHTPVSILQRATQPLFSLLQRNQLQRVGLLTRPSS